MNCRYCGAQTDEDAIFCGRCGYQLIDESTALVLHSPDTVDSSAPTVDDNMSAAMVALENPYHSLLPGLYMPNLILNDNSSRGWPDTKAAVVDIETEKGKTLAQFTLQAVVQFHRVPLRSNKPLRIGRFPRPGHLVWTIDLYADSNPYDDKAVWMRIYEEGRDLDLRHPSYEPFLLGIVKVKGESVLHVFVNLERLASINSDPEGECVDWNDETLRVSGSYVTISHCHLSG